jgi:hypothetical protein
VESEYLIRFTDFKKDSTQKDWNLPEWLIRIFLFSKVSLGVCWFARHGGGYGAPCWALS